MTNGEGDAVVAEKLLRQLDQKRVDIDIPVSFNEAA
jgi:hypothetical protein